MLTAAYNSPRDLLAQEGTRLGPTEWLLIDQERVNRFAKATGDHQWIHVDVERAKTGPFGGTIAHGYFILALVSYFLPQLLVVREVSMGVNVGVNRLRFLAPVLVGSHIRALGEIVKVEEIKGGVQTIVHVTMEIEGSEKPACIVDVISRSYPQALA